MPRRATSPDFDDDNVETETYGPETAEPPPSSKRTRGKRKENAADETPIRLVAYDDFLKGFVPPDYLVDGMLIRRFFYSLTAPPGAGKTAAALLLASLAGSVAGGGTFAGAEVNPGNVLYLAAENPDDIRMRLIGMRAKAESRVPLNIQFIEVRVPIPRLNVVLPGLAPIGGWSLVIVDTSPAYFSGDEENSNTQLGAHARDLRAMTKLPGGPTVIALCHPGKNAATPEDLVPRGGGAFNGELDGNLTLWKVTGEDKVTFHHLKIRGPSFERVEFKLETVTTTELVDVRGRLIPTVLLRGMGEPEAAQDRERNRAHDEAVLWIHGEFGDITRAEVARKLGWVGERDGVPLKSRVDRALKRLAGRKLVKVDKMNGGAVEITVAGKAEVDRIREAKSHFS